MSEHTETGNCMTMQFKCTACGRDNFCDVCHDHDMPRGACDECEVCEACDAEVPC